MDTKIPVPLFPGLGQDVNIKIRLNYRANSEKTADVIKDANLVEFE